MPEDEVSRRCREIDAELEALKARLAEIAREAYELRRDQLLGGLSRPEYKAWLEFLARRELSED